MTDSVHISEVEMLECRSCELVVYFTTLLVATLYSVEL
jgi:hypothetical protein